VLWKQLSTGGLHTWSVDANWNYVASNGIFAPSSVQSQLLPQQLGASRRVGSIDLIVDTITDFTVAEGDKIWLDDAIFTSGFAVITQTINSGDLELRFSGTLFATLLGQAGSPLSSADFVVF